MHSVFLHSRIRDGQKVAELVARNEMESQNLDFKGGFWEDSKYRCKECGDRALVQRPASVEAGKDVAAMANADGGDLIVGVDDTDDRASGWFGKPLPIDAHETLRRWLANVLAPREVTDTVEIGRMTARDASDGTEHDVLIVNVPPWSDGPVGVKSMDAYLFPLRRDRDTRFLSFEEIMRLNEGSRRSVYLRLKEAQAALAGQAAAVTILSPIIVRQGVVGGKGSEHKYVPSNPAGFNASLGDISQDSLHLTMWPSEPLALGVLVREALPVVIPLDLIDSVWLDVLPSGLKVLCVMATATLIHNLRENRWSLLRDH